MQSLENIRIVLVEPSHPGNIGAVARSMKTMGLTRLALVSPKKYPHYEASKRAASADDVLDNAVVVDELGAAINDCTLVLGTSVRDREVKWPTLDPRQAAGHLLSETNKFQNQAAILFGRENSGLNNSEMEACSAQIRIPANHDYSSLNLASAVQIVSYELRMLALQANQPEQSSNSEVNLLPAQKRRANASFAQREGHLQHLQKTLEQLEFIKSKPPVVLMRKLTRLYNKANLSVEEVQILRGILTAIQTQPGRSEEA